MLLLTEPTLFYWNLLNDLTSDLKAYKGTVSVWAHGIKNPKTGSAVSLLRSEANPTSTSGISTPSQFTKVTTISSATAPPQTPDNSDAGNDNVQIVGSLLDEDDEPERLAAHALMKKRPVSLHTVMGAAVWIFFKFTVSFVDYFTGCD
jgi:hypothetical protein